MKEIRKKKYYFVICLFSTLLLSKSCLRESVITFCSYFQELFYYRSTIILALNTLLDLWCADLLTPLSAVDNQIIDPLTFHCTQHATLPALPWILTTKHTNYIIFFCSFCIIFLLISFIAQFLFIIIHSFIMSLSTFSLVFLKCTLSFFNLWFSLHQILLQLIIFTICWF